VGPVLGEDSYEEEGHMTLKRQRGGIQKGKGRDHIKQKKGQQKEKRL